MDFTIKKCKTRAAYSSKPKKNIKLDLNKIKTQFPIIMETPILLVIKTQNIEIIIHSYGELIFKKTTEKDISKIEKIAEKIYQYIL